MPSRMASTTRGRAPPWTMCPAQAASSPLRHARDQGARGGGAVTLGTLPEVLAIAAELPREAWLVNVLRPTARDGTRLPRWARGRRPTDPSASPLPWRSWLSSSARREEAVRASSRRAGRSGSSKGKAGCPVVGVCARRAMPSGANKGLGVRYTIYMCGAVLFVRPRSRRRRAAPQGQAPAPGMMAESEMSMDDERSFPASRRTSTTQADSSSRCRVSGGLSFVEPPCCFTTSTLPRACQQARRGCGSAPMFLDTARDIPDCINSRRGSIDSRAAQRAAATGPLPRAEEQANRQQRQQPRGLRRSSPGQRRRRRWRGVAPCRTSLSEQVRRFLAAL